MSILLFLCWLKININIISKLYNCCCMPRKSNTNFPEFYVKKIFQVKYAIISIFYFFLIFIYLIILFLCCQKKDLLPYTKKT